MDIDIHKNAFLNRLETLRKAKGITRKQLLEDCSLGKNSITYWEKNNTVPTGAALQVLAQYFDVSVDYLLGEVEEPDILKPSAYEENLLRYFRQCDTEGQLRIIQLAMNEYDRTKAEQLNRHSAIG